MSDILTEAAEAVNGLSPLLTPPEPGIHTDISMAHYLLLDALGASGAHTLTSKTPCHYDWDRKHPSPAKPWTDKGTAMHCALLEPHLYAARYRVVPGKWNTNPWKKEKEAAEAEGLVPIHPGDDAEARMCRANAMAHPLLGPVFSDPRALIEQTMTWQVQAANSAWVACKARPDLLSPAHRLYVDVKTHGGDVDGRSFERAAESFGYDVKAAWYLWGCEVLGLPYDASLFVAIEQDAPCGIVPYAVDPGRLALARKTCEYAVNLYAECMATGTWPGYSPDIRTLFEER